MAEKFSLNSMTKGWFIGPFAPSVFNTDQFECAIKRYNAGDKESSHVHRVAKEYTVIIEGRVRMKDEILESDDIIEINPGEATDFEALTDAITVVVKVPAVLGDKYVC